LRGNVLLVDDNETNLMLGIMLLQGLGLKVKGANSGEAAVEEVAQHCFCAVLIDISMPGIDGFEATRRIRKLPGRDKMPILALTAYASSREQKNAREAGMNEYLTKPISQAQLARALGKWLPGSAAGGDCHQPSGAEVILNEGALEELALEIGTANLEQVLITFSKELQKRWQSLAKANSPTELARAAHSLVSTCRSFGFWPVGSRTDKKHEVFCCGDLNHPRHRLSAGLVKNPDSSKVPVGLSCASKVSSNTTGARCTPR
jgi:CheY-like chemotaxis protein